MTAYVPRNPKPQRQGLHDPRSTRQPTAPGDRAGLNDPRSIRGRRN